MQEKSRKTNLSQLEDSRTWLEKWKVDERDVNGRRSYNKRRTGCSGETKNGRRRREALAKEASQG